MHYLRIAFLILCFIYIYSYYKYPAKTQIIQTTMRNFNYDILLQKQPVIIDSADVNLDDLRRRWFYLNIVNRATVAPSQEWHDNKYKYTVMQANDKGEILLYPASKKMSSDGSASVPDPNESLLAIQISKGQLIILPFHWKYLVPDITVDCLVVNDLVSYFLP